MLTLLRRHAARGARLSEKVLRGKICPEALPYYYYFWQAERGKLSPARLQERLRRNAEYGEVIEPLLGEIDSTYRRFLYRSPLPQEVVRHIICFYEEFNTPGRRAAAIKRGGTLPHLGIRPLRLEMDIVNQCNLRCIMCHFSSAEFFKRKKQEISPEEFARVAEQVFPLCSYVSLSLSTEPLLHRKFGELLRIAGRYKIPFVYMHTNALLLNDRIIDQLIESKFNEVCISIDGATKQTYERIRVGANFERLIANIEAINRAKKRAGARLPRLGFNVVLMRSNIAELPSIIRLAHDLEVEGVGAVHMVPFAAAVADPGEESLRLHKDLCNRMLEEARAAAEKYHVRVTLPDRFEGGAETTPVSRRGDEHRDLRFLPLQAAPAQASCFFPWHFVGLDSVGNLFPCGWWYNEPAMGNLLTESFEQIWNNEQYYRLRSEHLKGPLRQVCQTCPAAGMGNVNNPSAFLEK
jgi:radical SAM protein with 4Fe4S-binding SPASM domain